MIFISEKEKTANNKKILVNLFLFVFFLFLLFFPFLTNGEENNWSITIELKEERYDFSIKWADIQKSNLFVDWKDCSGDNISFSQLEINKSESEKKYRQQFIPPQEACFAEIRLSGYDEKKDYSWTKEIKLKEIPLSFCGDGVCQDYESENTCFLDCFRSAKIDWRQLPIRNSWQESKNLPGGEGMQMIMDIDWNKHDSNVLYLTADTTKVWKSIDRGHTWFPVMKDSRNLGGVSIASDPKNKNIVYLAASMSIKGAKSYYDGIYRSIDGGESWVGPIGSEINFQRRHAGKLFIIDEKTYNGFQSLVVYAGTPEGLLRSEDGGANWNLIALDGIDIYAIDWAGAGSEHIYLSSKKGLYKYSILNNKADLIGSEIFEKVYGLAVDKNNDSILYVAAGTKGIWKSDDKGESFKKISANFDFELDYRRIVLDEKTSTKLFASPHLVGGLYPLYSHDKGNSWLSPNHIYSEEWIGDNYYYADPIVFDPENSDIAVSQADGPIIKTYDGGKNWHYSGSGYVGARVNNIDFIDEKTSLFCLIDYGILFSDNNGNSFESLNVDRVNNEKSCGAIDSSGKKIIASIGSWSKQDILISYDFGLSWTNVLKAESEFQFIKFNKDNDQIVYADYWHSFDGGQTWNRTGDNYRILAMDPYDGEIVYGAKKISSEEWTIGVSQDSGKTWLELGESLSAHSIEDIAVNPFGEKYHLLVAAVDKMIYEYVNSEWKQIGLDRGLKSEYSEGIYNVEFDSLREGIVWAGQRSVLSHGLGAYVSDTSGFKWIQIKSNFGEYHNIWNIEVSPFNSKVFLSGSGLWTYEGALCDGKICDICLGRNCRAIDAQTARKKIFSDFEINIYMEDDLIFREEAVSLAEESSFQSLSKGEKKMYDFIVESVNEEFDADEKRSIAFFIKNGTLRTRSLGYGERTAVLNSYKSSFDKLPKSVLEWEDVIKISNGRWPNERSEDAEAEAERLFQEIYLRKAEKSKSHDNSALKIIAYGLRPQNRNMDSEKFSIQIFEKIFKHIPSSALDWDVVRAIAYSGAVR